MWLGIVLTLMMRITKGLALPSLSAMEEIMMLHLARQCAMWGYAMLVLDQISSVSTVHLCCALSSNKRVAAASDKNYHWELLFVVCVAIQAFGIVAEHHYWNYRSS